MERVPVDKMELYENYTVEFNKANLLGMLIGLLWIVVVMFVIRNQGLLPLGCLSISIPPLLAASKFRATKGLFFSILFGTLLIIGLIGLLILLERFFKGWQMVIIFYILFFSAFIFLWLLYGKYSKEHLKKEFVDERLSAIEKRSEIIASRIFIYVVVFTFAVFYLAKIQLSSYNYMALILATVFVFSAIRSVSFLFFYKKT